MIDRDNPYPRGYRILYFSLFSGEDGQSTLEHVARFIVQCGELDNYENFYHFKLRLFPNSLTGAVFTWYTTLPRNSIQSWQKMERQFHTQFFRVKPKLCIAELSRVTQSVKPGKNLIFLKNGKNSKIAEMVQESLEIFLDLG